MKSSPKKSLPVILAGAIAALVLAAEPQIAGAATFTWGNPTPVTGTFMDGTKWLGGTAPSGNDATDVLVFGGDVGLAGAPTSYIATSDGLGDFFTFNRLTFEGTTTTPGSGPFHTIDGTTPLFFGGTNPTITQAGSAAFVIDPSIRLGANLTLAGNIVNDTAAHDVANITMNGGISGNFDITKTGSSTFRFGSSANFGPSANTWFGTLTIGAGTIRFNNNAYTAPTALRANPVVMNSATALLTTQFRQLDATTIPPPNNRDPESSLRFGTLSGTAGLVEGRRETAVAGVFDGIDMTITTLNSGSFAGTVRNAPVGTPTATTEFGTFSLRGVGTQTFTGTLDFGKDVKIGDIATMVIGGTATLGAQLQGAIILGGGTLRLDNATINNSNRLRNGLATSTAIETIGGGTLSLVGNAAGTQESTGRLQLGSAGNSRSGALTINVTHNATTAVTSWNFEAFSRDAAGSPYDTVNFTANNGTGTVLALGPAGTSGPRVTFSAAFLVPVFNGLIGNTGVADASSVGWATVNGTDFASYGANGVFAVASVAAPGGATTGDATVNAFITANTSLTNAGGYALNSLKIAPTLAAQALDLANAGTLRTNAILLAGTNDFTINASGGGTIANVSGVSPRYFHVASAMLTVNASVAGAVAPIVKAGNGTLVLTNPGNIALDQPVVINAGTLRATPGSSLPDGEIRFRGGVLEITGGGTFARTLGLGLNRLTWSGVGGVGEPIGQEQGSGGFAAVGADVTVDLTPTPGTTDFAWEDTGFVNSGHALVFGSPRATAKVTWIDNINLTAAGQVTNYNARQFRAIDNPATTADVAVLSGTISGTLQNDLLKTGNGELILSGSNAYSGATLVTDGTLRVNGSTESSYLTDVRSGATLGGSGAVGSVQVELGGNIAPGDLAGTTSILSTGEFKLSGATARLTIEIGGTTAGGNGVSGYDRLNVTGGVTLSGGTLAGSLLNGFNASPADLFFIIVNDGAEPVQGVFAQGSSVTIGAQIFTIGYGGNFTGTPATSTFTGGNDVVLRLVPEPGAGALLGAGLALLAARRRRSR